MDTTKDREYRGDKRGQNGGDERKEGGNPHHNRGGFGSRSGIKEIKTCYQCDLPGHMMRDCPTQPRENTGHRPKVEIASNASAKRAYEETTNAETAVEKHCVETAVKRHRSENQYKKTTPEGEARQEEAGANSENKPNYQVHHETTWFRVEPVPSGVTEATIRSLFRAYMIRSIPHRLVYVPSPGCYLYYVEMELPSPQLVDAFYDQFVNRRHIISGHIFYIHKVNRVAIYARREADSTNGNYVLYDPSKPDPYSIPWVGPSQTAEMVDDTKTTQTAEGGDKASAEEIVPVSAVSDGQGSEIALDVGAVAHGSQNTVLNLTGPSQPAEMELSISTTRTNEERDAAPAVEEVPPSAVKQTILNVIAALFGPASGEMWIKMENI